MKLLRRVAPLLVAGVGIASAQPLPEQPAPDQPAPEQPAPLDPSTPTIAIRGRVIDALGRPVRNATVTIEGGSDSVKTGRDGWFKLRAPIGSTLVIDSKTFG